MLSSKGSQSLTGLFILFAATAAAVADAAAADVFVVFDRSKAKKGLALMVGIAAADGEI